MMQRLFNIKIPSLLGIVLLLAGVGMTSFLVDRGVILQGRAAPDKTPTNIAITNVSPTEFTVMYTTAESVAGSLSYGTNKDGTGSVALDDRDQQTGRTTASTIHHITVRNLAPDTTYFFSILSGGDVFKNQDEAYEVTTAPALAGTLPEATPITGSVSFPETIAQQDLLVVFTSKTLQSRSAVVTADGTYTLPVSGIRTLDLSQYASLTDSTTGELVIVSAGTASHATVLLQNTDPVPRITFGQSYDFTLSTEPLPEKSASGSAAQAFPQAAESTSGPTIRITSPDEAETFTDQQPVFSGSALPGEDIDIIIHSDQAATATIQAGEDGTWEFRPPEPLNPGNHTITIKTRDLTGTLREFTRAFTVYAQGSQFIEPSVSPTRTPTPTLTTDEPTPTPTEEIVPTATATVAPTAAIPTPTAVLTGIPTPTSPPPVSGGREIALGGILGAGTLIIGVALFLLTRGSLL
jgi:hypothetical protein